MTIAGLSAGVDVLRLAASNFFADRYERPKIHVGKPLHNDLNWVPGLWFSANDHLTILAEPSEDSAYPKIFEMRHADVLQFPEPIALYAICPEEVALKSSEQEAIRRLEDHGHGLITVNRNGQVQRRLTAVALVQVISRREYKASISALPKNFRQRIGVAFEDYCNRPSSGVGSLSEVVEGLVIKAGDDAVQRQFITRGALGNTVADNLDALHSVPQFKGARAAIGGVRGYIHRFRNVSHHWPKRKRDAYRKYRDCRLGFLEGIEHIKTFREAMINAGISGGLPQLVA